MPRTMMPAPSAAAPPAAFPGPAPGPPGPMPWPIAAKVVPTKANMPITRTTTRMIWKTIDASTIVSPR